MDDRNSLSLPVLGHHRAVLAGMAILLTWFCAGAPSPLDAGQPDWIWSPQKSGLVDTKPGGDCFFRKKFTLVGPERAELIFTAGDQYEIYLNGRLAARGQSFGEETTIDVSELIEPGVNLIAARIRHFQSPQAGLALRFRVKEKGELRWRSLQTDDTWKTRITEVPEWMTVTYNDLGWIRAQSLAIPDPAIAAKAPKEIAPSGPSGSGIAANFSDQDVNDSSNRVVSRVNDGIRSPVINPASDDVAAASDPADELKKRFTVDPEFTVESILSGSETGSLIAMTFNEFGKLLLSQEGGPLLIADPSKPVGDPKRIRVYCDQVNSCQGILALNGDVYVTGIGPEGLGLYQLTDPNRDGQLTVAHKLVSFTGEPGEHGPHGIQLGPDGMLYVVIGNGSQVDGDLAETSPYRHTYEGDLIPRFEDPGGQAFGVKAPGGTIIRVAIDGSTIERFAGGLRNAYDLIVSPDGELFVHDSDMESDLGMTWYRPTLAFHVPAGAELGWRSGWSKFPQHFIDQTPSLAETGRGSPTGAVQYQHLQFPKKYHNAIFLADWSEGRILAMTTEPSGAGYQAKVTTFASGRPMNICDLAIGEDGGLYFCTGGRGTTGGVFRISFNADAPSRYETFDSDLAKVLNHPQPQSAWARQNIAQIRMNMGDQWGVLMQGAAENPANPDSIRVRALQLLVLFGPAPDSSLLDRLVQDTSASVRSQVARICGLIQSPTNDQRLQSLIRDRSPIVRRIAGESCLRLQAQPDWSSLEPMLASEDRIESLIARRLLERIPASQWESSVLQATDKRVFFNGSLALLTAEPNLERAYLVLARCAELMEEFLEDRDFIDLLRTAELALARGQVDAQRVPGLTQRMIDEFPSSSGTINQELARILGYLKAGDFGGRLETYFANESVSPAEKVHVAMYLIAGQENATAAERLAIVDALETARNIDGVGGSYDLYVQDAIANISEAVANTDLPMILNNGHRWPKTVLTAFYRLPADLEPETVKSVIELDQRIRSVKPIPATEQVRLGVIAILARDGDPEAMDYLRLMWQQEPQRRSDIVIGLAQQPDDENWSYLVSSLAQLDDLTGIEVLEKLIDVPRRPRDAQHYRDLLQLGYRLHGEGSLAACRLIEHWAGESPEQPAADWQTGLDSWKRWFESRWPDEAPIATGNATQSLGRYSVSQILSHVDQSGLGNPERGQEWFTKAQCALCHRVNGIGKSVGPELSNLANRFSLRELVESTIHPSAVIPDRYTSRAIATVDGITIVGMAIPQTDGSYFVLQSDGERIRIAADDIEAVEKVDQSAMPEKLLDTLTIEEVSDLLGFLMRSQPATKTAQGSSTDSSAR